MPVFHSPLQMFFIHIGILRLGTILPSKDNIPAQRVQFCLGHLLSGQGRHLLHRPGAGCGRRIGRQGDPRPDQRQQAGHPHHRSQQAKDRTLDKISQQHAPQRDQSSVFHR